MKKLFYVMLATFFVCLSLVSSASASTTVQTIVNEKQIENLPTFSGQHVKYLIGDFNNGTGTRLFAFYSSEPFEVDSYVNGNTIYCTFSENVTQTLYSWSASSNQWSPNATETKPANAMLTIGGMFANVRYSSFDIRSGFDSEEIFFQGAPTEELYQMTLRVMTEELQNQSLTLVGTMRILTVCGVGLIALLIGLNLFGKVFRIFRVG